MNHRWLCGGAAAALTLAFSAGAAAAQTRACEDLKRLSRADSVIDAAETVPAGEANGQPLPEHCHVRGVINPRTGADGREYGVGYDLRMPAEWNGRFMYQGGGGMEGSVPDAFGTVPGMPGELALARGFAVVATDGGHSGSPLDSSFAADQQARIDFAHGALDRATLKAKALIRDYYGRGPDWSYFLGCSTGGRQGMLASQRFPLHFDGIVAGDPAMKFTRLAMNQVWHIQTIAAIAPVNADGAPILSRAFTQAQLDAARDAIMARCDALDGLEDGMIQDWLACDFDPAQLACSVNDAETCFSDAQVDALHKLAQGPVGPDGRPLYGRAPYDSGFGQAAWRGMRMGNATDGTWDASDVTLGFETLRQYAMTPSDPDFDPMTFDFTDPADIARTEEVRALGDADATMLSSFAGNGKMIVYNGNSDQGMASGAMADWYEKMVDDTGPAGADAVRLFLVPGMNHCAGGEATDRFDTLTAITEWVEEGRAPDRIIATGESFPGAARPLCPYPQVARYEGGDPNEAASFACRE